MTNYFIFANRRYYPGITYQYYYDKTRRNHPDGCKIP